MRRRHFGLVFASALAACTSPGAPAAPASFAGPKAAFFHVCGDPATSVGIDQAVHDLRWNALSGSEVPRWLIGNGAVRWSHVVTSPDGDLLIAVGRLHRTSFCRVYGRNYSLEAEMAAADLFERPLGPANLRQSLPEGRSVSWLKSEGDDWRAVRLSGPQDAAAEPGEPFITLEMTRPVLEGWSWDAVRRRLSARPSPVRQT